MQELLSHERTGVDEMHTVTVVSALFPATTSITISDQGYDTTALCRGCMVYCWVPAHNLLLFLVQKTTETALRGGR